MFLKKIGTMPPPAMTVNYQCGQQLDVLQTNHPQSNIYQKQTTRIMPEFVYVLQLVP